MTLLRSRLHYLTKKANKKPGQGFFIYRCARNQRSVISRRMQSNSPTRWRVFQSGWTVAWQEWGRYYDRTRWAWSKSLNWVFAAKSGTCRSNRRFDIDETRHNTSRTHGQHVLLASSLRQSKTHRMFFPDTEQFVFDVHVVASAKMLPNFVLLTLKWAKHSIMMCYNCTAVSESYVLVAVEVLRRTNKNHKESSPLTREVYLVCGCSTRKTIRTNFFFIYRIYSIVSRGL